MFPLPAQAAPWGRWGKAEVTCPRPVESNARVGDRDRAAEKAPEEDDTHTRTQGTSNSHCLFNKFCEDYLKPRHTILKFPVSGDLELFHLTPKS